MLFSGPESQRRTYWNAGSDQQHDGLFPTLQCHTRYQLLLRHNFIIRQNPTNFHVSRRIYCWASIVRTTF